MNKIILGSLLIIICFCVFRSQETPNSADMKAKQIYFYMKGWNDGIDKIYRSEDWRSIKGEDRLVPIGGFTGVSIERAKETILENQWDWKKMRYKTPR